MTERGTGRGEEICSPFSLLIYTVSEISETETAKKKKRAGRYFLDKQALFRGTASVSGSGWERCQPAGRLIWRAIPGSPHPAGRLPYLAPQAG